MLFEPVAAITDSEMARELRQFREVKARVGDVEAGVCSNPVPVF